MTRSTLRASFTSGDIIDFDTREVIDRALVFFMPSPHSFTGEDVAELQFHGSPLLVQKILRSLYAFGIAPAEPGEFTKRAYLSGKLDLIQAEAIADLINASSEQALKVAGEQLKGRLSNAVDHIAEPLRDLLAEVEANIDFAEEDIEPDSLNRIISYLRLPLEQIQALVDSYSYGSVVKEGFRVLLCGKPNVGKSSILNLILGRNRAIVSEQPGTTRDILEEDVVIGNHKFVFCDSAGLRESDNVVEKIGVELAREKIPWADLILLVIDAEEEQQANDAVLAELKDKAKKIWFVVNKIDRNPHAVGSIFCDLNTCERNFYLSAKTLHGLDALIIALREEVEQRNEDSADRSIVITNERHRNCLAKAKQSLETLSKDSPLEVISLEIKSALSALNEIIGKTTTEDILGRIFSKFCIGK
jgi:tRNA modification GTPase